MENLAHARKKGDIFLTTIWLCSISKKRFTVVHHSKKGGLSVKGKKLVVADLPQIFKFPSHFLPVSTYMHCQEQRIDHQCSSLNSKNTQWFK